MSFGLVHIEGELTNFKIAKGMWVYFDLKDEGASLKCFGTIHMLPGPLEDGMKVRLVCAPRLHPRFNFSLQVQTITPSGEGALVKAAQLLRRQLESEGLFDFSRKRALPHPPESIALVASSESAAYADFVKIIRVRWPLVTITVFETLVQGESAPDNIVHALEQAGKQAKLAEVLVLIRGGGSADDLRAFSDERVVRAVAACRIPTMAAIGHETDESLVELVSDARASTPSNAAELLVPDIHSMKLRLASESAQISTYVRSMTELIHTEITAKRTRMLQIIEQLYVTEKSCLASARQLMNAYNPEAVLRRGYALVRRGDIVVSLGTDLKINDELSVQFYDVKRAVKVVD